VNFEQEKWIKKHKETFALSTLWAERISL